jgi:hypothetical protein
VEVPCVTGVCQGIQRGYLCPILEFREVKKFSLEEIKEFELKFAEIKKRENLERVVGFIFSRSGFTKEAEAYCKEKGIACSEDERWLESGK